MPLSCLSLPSWGPRFQAQDAHEGELSEGMYGVEQLYETMGVVRSDFVDYYLYEQSEKRRLFSESVGAKRLLDDGECHP